MLAVIIQDMTLSTSSPDKEHTPLDHPAQIQKMRLMLNLAIARIEHSIQESDDSVSQLTQAVTTMADSFPAIEKAAKRLGKSQSKNTILNTYQKISSEMQSAIVALQFYDRFTQRLTHVSKSLAELSALINDEKNPGNPSEWNALQEKIRQHYTLDADIEMVNEILAGKPVADAIKKAGVAHVEQASRNKEIELF